MSRVQTDKSRKILLIGKNGQIGWELRRALEPLGTLIPCGHEELDLSSPDHIREKIREIAPDIIVNAAGYSLVDQAEEEKNTAMAVNGTGPGVLAEEAKKLGAGIVHYSTDYVFDGKSRERPYTETDSPNPLNYYGETKLRGDQAIAASGAAYLLLRVSWVYGLRKQNFLTTIQNLAQERDELRIVDDQVGSPTWCVLIADATGKILEKIFSTSPSKSSPFADFSGLYHMTCQGQTSWHGFAKALLAGSPGSPSATLRAIPSSDYPTAAQRPNYSVLSSEKLKKTFAVTLPSWQEALTHCLNSRMA